jgi:flagellar hook-associated protein 1 FlgK
MIFNEANGSGLSQAMSKFWNAWQSLAGDPGDTTERQVLVTASQILATTFNQLGADLSQAQQDLDLVVQGTVADINRLAEQLVDLNAKIISSEAGSLIITGSFLLRRMPPGIRMLYGSTMTATPPL